MNLLQKFYLGNKLQDWLIALSALIIVFAVLKLLQAITIRRLSKLAASTDNQIDDFFVVMLKQTKLFILIIVSAYFASYALVFKPSVSAIWGKIIVLALILQGGFWGAAGISFAFGNISKKRSEEDVSSKTTVTFLGFVARFVLWIIILLLVLDNLGINITGLVAGLGIGGVAVALAVQNILGDLLASLSIVLDKPFVIGDFVVVDTMAGTIEHIGIKTTRIRSLSGEQLIFSNNDLLKSRIRNFKRMSARRVVFSFGVVYQTSLEKLKAIKNIVEEIIERQEMARFDRVHFKEYGEYSLNYEVVYHVASQDFKIYMDTQEAINLEIFRRFADEGIVFAYPTQAVFIQKEQG